MENCKLQKKKGKKKNVNTLVIFLNIKPFLNYLSLNMEKKRCSFETNYGKNRREEVVI